MVERRPSIPAIERACELEPLVFRHSRRLATERTPFRTGPPDSHANAAKAVAREPRTFRWMTTEATSHSKGGTATIGGPDESGQPCRPRLRRGMTALTQRDSTRHPVSRFEAAVGGSSAAGFRTAVANAPFESKESKSDSALHPPDARRRREEAHSRDGLREKESPDRMNQGAFHRARHIAT